MDEHAAPVAAAGPSVPPIVDAEWVRANQPLLADVRWYLDGRSGLAAYESGHLPGAVFIDLDAALAGHDLPPTEGRHPLPEPEHFAEAMAAAGIGDDTTVVAYDDTGGMTAGRLVVMLRMLGRRAALLDGGLAAWDGDLETGPQPPVERARFAPAPWPSDRLARQAEIEEVAAGDDELVLLDARAAERFIGEVTAIDPRPGHIPGARNAPWNAVLDLTTGRVRSGAELREHFAALGIDDGTDVVSSCGSGVSACLNVLALEQAGLPPARLYVASFSGWSADPDHAVATG